MRRYVRRILLSAAILPTLATTFPPAIAQTLPQPEAQPPARITLQTRTDQALAGALDAGATPSSQRLTLTLTLAPSAAQSAALDQYLTALTTPSSPTYHQWLTPSQFAARFAPTPDQVAAATAWAQSQNLSVESVSPSNSRITVAGSASQIESALAVTLHNYQIKGSLFFASTAQPTLPATAASLFTAPLFSAVDGLDDLPTTSTLNATYLNAKGTLTTSAVAFSDLANLIDQNLTPVLTLDSSICTAAVSQSQIAEFTTLLRQASAQGITLLADRACNAGAFPAALPYATAIGLPGDLAETSTPIALRPSWQAAPGLPSDGLRDAPDLTGSTLSAFAQTISTLAAQTPGGRLGNINSTLYALAPEPGIFTPSNSAAPGTWQPATGLGLVDLAALTKAWPRGAGANALSLLSSAYTPTHGQSFTLTATAASANGGPIPTGTVTFSSPSTAFTAATFNLNSAGVATSTAWLLPGGNYNITGTYSGDANYTSTTATVNVTVQPEAALFTITAPSTVTLGSNVTSTVTLTSASGFGTPSASVTVTPSGIIGAKAITQVLTGTTGTASGTFTFTTAQAGSVAMQASCTSNDQSFTCFTPQTATTTVPQATPSVVLTATPSAPSAGTPVVLAASVSGISGIGPTGTVQFFDGATALGSGSAPSASYTATLAPGTTHVLTAVYQGDTNYIKTTSNTVNTNVSTASTKTTVSASASTAAYGQSVTLNITVTPSTTVNGTLPTGTLTFTGAGTTTTAAVSGGAAVVTLTNLPVGSYTIGTSYSGDVNYAASTGNTVAFTVTQSTATLSTQLSSTSFTTGSTSTLTVTVTLPGSAALPTGSTFIAAITGVAGATYTGTFAINTGGNTGTGSVIIPAPPSGSYTLSITCGTNANFTCTPSTLSITSTATAATTTGTTATTTTLSISPTIPLAGSPITLTATVSTATTGLTAITGTVTFYDGTTLLGTGTIAAVGSTAVATATATLTGATTHSLTAVYSGSTVYATSTSTPLVVTAGTSPAAITLTSNVSYSLSGYAVVLTANVTGNTSTGTTPTGTVSFYIAGATPRLLGTASLGTAGAGLSVAVLSTANIPDGTQTIYAVYSGDTNFSSVISNNITIGVSDYTLTFLPQSLTLTQGQSGQTTLILGIVNQFAGTVVFGCTPPPNTEITCSFSPTTLTGGGTSTMTIITTAPTTAALHPPAQPFLKLTGGISLAALLCLFLPIGKRRRLPAMLLVLLDLGLTLNLGCSSNNFTKNNTVSNPGTPLGTINIVVNTAGTDGTNTVNHNYTYQVTVQ